MNYKIDKVNVSYDHLTFTSDDRRKIVMDNDILKPYYDVLSITNNKEPGGSYPYYSGFINKETGNQVKCFYERNNNHRLPNLVLKFNSSWECPLACSEVAFVLYRFIEVFNVGFNLSEFHPAIDLFSKENYIAQLAGCTKSRRSYDPPEHPKRPGTYYFHSMHSEYQLVLYDKGQQLLEDKGGELTPNTIEFLGGVNVARYEARIDNTRMNLITSFEQLATSNLSFLMPNFIQFLQPNPDKFIKYGLEPKHWDGLGLKAIREQLRNRGVHNNFFDKLEEQPDLTRIVGDALKNFRWCTCDEKCTIVKPRITMNPPRNTFNLLRKDEWYDE